MSEQEKVSRRGLLGGAAATGAAVMFMLSSKPVGGRATDTLDDNNTTLVRGLIKDHLAKQDSLKSKINSLDEPTFINAVLSAVATLIAQDDKQYESQIFARSPLRALAAIDENGRKVFSEEVLKEYRLLRIRSISRNRLSPEEIESFKALVVQISAAAQREIDSMFLRR